MVLNIMCHGFETHILKYYIIKIIHLLTFYRPNDKIFINYLGYISEFFES